MKVTHRRGPKDCPKRPCECAFMDSSGAAYIGETFRRSQVCTCDSVELLDNIAIALIQLLGHCLEPVRPGKSPHYFRTIGGMGGVGVGFEIVRLSHVSKPCARF